MAKGFTQIPHGFHKRLVELTGSELKVWMVHRSMEGKEKISTPSLSFLKTCTGLNLQTIKEARKSLRDKGWLETTGQVHTKKGHFTVPIVSTAIPTVVGKTDAGSTDDGESTQDRGGNSTCDRVGKTVVGFLDSEVVPFFEVATNCEVETEEEDCASGAMVSGQDHKDA